MAALKISEVEMRSYHSLHEACGRLQTSLQNELAPEVVTAKSISEHLKKQFVFLTGGRAKDDAVVLTFPECPGFCAVPDEDVKQVLAYLTTISSLRKPEVKFTVILDRRLDSWISVKAALCQIAEIILCSGGLTTQAPDTKACLLCCCVQQRD